MRVLCDSRTRACAHVHRLTVHVPAEVPQFGEYFLAIQWYRCSATKSKHLSNVSRTIRACYLIHIHSRACGCRAPGSRARERVRRALIMPDFNSTRKNYGRPAPGKAFKKNGEHGDELIENRATTGKT